MKREQPLFNRIEQMREHAFIFFLFVTALVFRLPTLFNDFYDVDELAAIVQTKEFLAGFRPGADFAESKLPLYHAVFKFSYGISAAYGWVIVHAVTILVVFLTALSVYYIGKTVRDRKTGIIASIMYAVLISSFNRHFMATNGEVIYNLPLTAGLMFFILLLKSRSLALRVLYTVLTCLSAYAAMKVKLHGTVLLMFIIFFFTLYLPYYRNYLRRMLVPYSVIAASVLLAVVFDYYITRKFAPGMISRILGLLFYATSDRSSNPLFLAGIYTYRQLTLALWHFALWVPASIYMYRFIKGRFRRETVEESAVALFALVTFLMVFAGGARLYYHYFMSAYPSLCVAAAVALVSADFSIVKRLYSCLAAALLIPGLFFLSWNMKDIYIRYFNRDLFYNEPAPLFWFRAVVVSSMDDYLLPNGIYRDTVEYIKNRTKPEDTIFVWGDGPHLYYFSDRRIAIHHVWPKGGAIKIEQLYRENTPAAISEAGTIENGFIDKMESRKPALFIDTSPKGLHRGLTRLGNFAKYPYNVPPLMKKYLDGHYRLEAIVDDYRIYRRIR